MIGALIHGGTAGHPFGGTMASPSSLSNAYMRGLEPGHVVRQCCQSTTQG